MTDNIIWKIKPHWERISAENELKRQDWQPTTAIGVFLKRQNVDYHGDPLPSDSEPDDCA